MNMSDKQKIVVLVSLILLLGVVGIMLLVPNSKPTGTSQFTVIPIKDIDHLEGIIKNVLSGGSLIDSTTTDSLAENPSAHQAVRDPFQFNLPKPVPDPKTRQKINAKPVQPTGPPAPPRRSLAGLKLFGIVYDATTPSVIINGDVYYSGDIVQGFRIEKILRESVLLSADGQEYVLNVPEPR